MGVFDAFDISHNNINMSQTDDLTDKGPPIEENFSFVKLNIYFISFSLCYFLNAIHCSFLIYVFFASSHWGCWLLRLVEMRDMHRLCGSYCTIAMLILDFTE